MSGWGGGATRGRIGADRWHFQHGPIDLIIGVDIDADADVAVRDAAIEECWSRFQGVLPTLVAELAALKRTAQGHEGVAGPVARRMLSACAPFAQERFVTPMAAVAGAVADELIGVFARPGVRRAFINNGGDIALWLTPGTEYRAGIWSRVDRLVEPSLTGQSEPVPGQLQGPLVQPQPQPAAARAEGSSAQPQPQPQPPPADPLDARFSVAYASPVRGIATSGWRGRSQSLGIADSVTVLACSAAIADAAATMIANAVNSDVPGIVRAPASQLKDDSDLGVRLVTVDVPPLPAAAVAAALALGRAEAERWRDRGLVHAAALFLQGQVDVVLAAGRVDALPDEWVHAGGQLPAAAVAAAWGAGSGVALAAAPGSAIVAASTAASAMSAAWGVVAA